ncbi:MAG: hypothetical protein H6834_09760 [Planctomycetes bacterium]|nr:hypothetical protein [Planctomycetota bacterium]
MTDTLSLRDVHGDLRLPIEGAEVKIGTDARCGVRLPEDRGVDPVHAILRVQDGHVVLLDRTGGEGRTRVNDQPVLQVEVQVGDRLTFGTCVFELAREGAARAVATTPHIRPRERKRTAEAAAAEPARSWPKWAPAALAILIMAVIALILKFTTSVDEVAVLEGSVRDAMAQLGDDLVSDEPARADETREKLEGYFRDLEGLGKGSFVAEQRALLVRRGTAIREIQAIYDAWWGSPAALRKRLLPYQSSDDRGLQRLARRLVDKAEAMSPTDRYSWIPPHDAEDSSVPTDVAQAKPPVREERTEQPTLKEPAHDAAAWRVIESQVQSEAKEGRYARALEILRLAQGETEASFDPRIVDQLYTRVWQEAFRDVRDLRDRADRMHAENKANEALALLAENVDRFPAGREFDTLRERMTTWQTAIAQAERSKTTPHVAPTRPVESTPSRPETTPPTRVAERSADRTAPIDPTDIDESLRQVRIAEVERDHARAKEILTTLSTQAVLAADVRERVDGWLVDLEREEAFLRQLSQAVAQDPAAFANVRVGEEKLAVRGADADSVALAETAGSERRVSWAALSPLDVAKLYDVVARSLDADASLAAATYFERTLMTKQGDAILQRLVKRNRGLMPEVNGILARTRGEAVPEGGFAWYEERWVSPAEKEAIDRKAHIKTLLAKLESSNPKTREEAFDELSFLGPDATGSLILALQEKRDELAQKILEAPFLKTVERVAQLRTKLDETRAHALELIFDTETYFYPYKPPACPAEKAKLYPAVQREVNDRVAKVREVWDDPTAVKVPGSLRKTLAFLIEVSARLDELGGRGTDPLADIPWIYGLDPSEEAALTVRSYAHTLDEARGMRNDRMIVAWNDLVAEKEGATNLEAKQVRITNDYRLMMGRHALAWNPKLQRATRSHSEEMATLGYFSHFSPTPGRENPFSRMKLEGYTRGHGENIAGGGGAKEVHERWCQSSGHHRNILAERHKEMATGNSGHLWTQNFGGLEEYKSHDTWFAMKEGRIKF